MYSVSVRWRISVVLSRQGRLYTPRLLCASTSYHRFLHNYCANTRLMKITFVNLDYKKRWYYRQLHDLQFKKWDLHCLFLVLFASLITKVPILCIIRLWMFLSLDTKAQLQMDGSAYKIFSETKSRTKWTCSETWLWAYTVIQNNGKVKCGKAKTVMYETNEKWTLVPQPSRNEKSRQDTARKTVAKGSSDWLLLKRGSNYDRENIIVTPLIHLKAPIFIWCDIRHLAYRWENDRKHSKYDDSVFMAKAIRENTFTALIYNKIIGNVQVHWHPTTPHQKQGRDF